jgi:hypothetical protein
MQDGFALFFVGAFDCNRGFAMRRRGVCGRKAERREKGGGKGNLGAHRLEQPNVVRAWLTSYQPSALGLAPAGA